MTKNQILTKKQKQFFDTLKNHIKKTGLSPTVQELQRALKLSSPRAVTQYLETLQRKGLISKTPYEARGIKVRERETPYEEETVQVPVMASAGCDNVNIFAQMTFDEYMCIGRDALAGKRLDNVVIIKAIGDSMVDGGILAGDHVLVEVTENVTDNDLVVAIVDGFAVIKKLQLANNAVILQPVSSDPQYRPIILNKSFRIFGKVIDIIRESRQQGEIEVVPVYNS
jgi:repressor LexA